MKNNMNMNDDKLNTGAIRQLLNRSLAQLDGRTLDGLRTAREHALQRHASARARSPLHATLSSYLLWHTPALRFASVLLVVGLIGSVGYYWQQSQDNSEDVDIAILTDDLPINYYTDTNTN